MRRSYRLVLILVFLAAVIAGGVESHLEHADALKSLRNRLISVSVALREAVAANITSGRADKLERTITMFAEQERGASAVVCSNGRPIAFERNSLPWAALCGDRESALAETTLAETTQTVYETTKKADGHEYLVVARRVEPEGQRQNYSLLLIRSTADVYALSRAAFFRAMFTALGGALLAFALIRLLTHWVLKRSLQYLVKWTRFVFAGQKTGPQLRNPNDRLPPEFHELTRELSRLALRVRRPRVEKALDRTGELGRRVAKALKGRKLVVVANREPYMHVRNGDTIAIVRPASGVVSALEPIMRLCGGGIWVGHGSGSADHEVVDRNNEIQVPPENPTYTLRRVWLSKEEEDGYYYGFANEGLWPLCHLAYTRPTFRLTDWKIYKAVNEKFAETTLRGLDASKAVILVQDYHYALLPRLLRERSPDATIELFWHIPWPNPEAFGICPQYKELLEGMLGADVVGFHTQFHCNNFLETCDRFLEARVDWENFSVTVGNRETLVRSYPISIATEPVAPISMDKRTELLERYGINVEHIALGVDRIDYTKGLVERVNGVERFLEKYPQYAGRFSFVEMGTPSRTNIASYRALIEEVEGAIARVCARFGREGYRPIILLKGHFDWPEVAQFYQLGAVCLVTSLHDGMNLVAKEYVWSQSPDAGALVLSRFTGAARELPDALIVNPYSSEEIADALFKAINLAPNDRRMRMLRMKERVSGHNAFHWATDLLAGVNAKV